MAGRLHPRQEAAASPDPDVTAQPAILSPPSPQATPPTPHHEHADTLPDRRDSHNPRQPSVTPQEPPEMDARPGRLKRRAPPSRDSSPGSARSTSPDPSAVSTALKRLEALTKRVRDASPPQLSPPSPPPTRHKGKEPAADCPPSPSTDGDTASTRPASPDRSDGESLHEAATPARTAPLVPAAKQLEIDAVISRLPPPAPRIEADPAANIEIDDRLQVDEGFCDESLESHYQAFVDATEEIRCKRRPYYRVRTPGAEKGSALVQRSVVQKCVRMRKREPKPGRGRGSVVAAGEAVASSSAV